MKLFAILTIALFLLSACVQVEQQKIKIGVSTPHTGPAAAAGSWVRNGIELAMERLPAEDRAQIELIYEDDQCKADTGITVAHKLVEIDNVKFIMGPLCGTVANPTKQYYDDNKVLRMLSGVGLETNIGKGDFILLGSAEALMKELAHYAYEEGIRNVSIIYTDDEYGRDNIKWFEKYFSGNVLLKESFARGESDFRTQLGKIKPANPDAVFLVAYGPPLVNILKQMKELGIETRKLSLINTEDTEIVKLGSDLVEGILYSSIIDSTTSDVKTWFQQRYAERFGAPPEAVATSAFDSFNILYSAVKSCNQDVECVRQTISQTKDYIGASGTLSVDEQGVGIRKPAVKMIEDGKFVYAEE